MNRASTTVTVPAGHAASSAQARPTRPITERWTGVVAKITAAVSAAHHGRVPF